MRCPFALLFAGVAPASIPTPNSGTFLVAPPWPLSLLVALPAGGLDLDVDIPPDVSLIGVAFYAQAIEADSGASKKLSFTPGLKLVLGGA